MTQIEEDKLADFLNEKGLALLDTSTMAIVMPSGYTIGDCWTVFSSNWAEEKGFKKLSNAVKNAGKR